MSYDNLRTKTVFDFTDDEKLLKSIIGDRELYLSGMTETTRAMALLHLADITNNKELEAAVELEFNQEFSLFFNE